MVYIYIHGSYGLFNVVMMMMIYDDLWWIMMIYDNICIYIYIIIYIHTYCDDIRWCIMIHYDMIICYYWWFMIIHDIWWYTMIYNELWWYIMIQSYNDGLIHHFYFWCVLFLLWNIGLLQLGYDTCYYQIGIHFSQPIGLGITSLGTCSSDFHRDFPVEDCFVELFTLISCWIEVASMGIRYLSVSILYLIQ